MADKIKRFFSKKKADVKFKKAGPGNKLSSEGSHSASSSHNPPDYEVPSNTPMTEERKLAAHAALLRLEQKKVNPNFNTSLSAIQAQVKRELELEKKKQLEEQTKKADNEKPSQVNVEISSHLAASGVYFRCPIISDEVLSKEVWKKNIKKFLYEQLAEEPALTACLIIQSCNTGKERIDACTETLCKYLENIVSHPEEDKYKKIRLSNRIYTEKVKPIEGSQELLHAAGFRSKMIPNNEGIEEEFLVFEQENVDSLDSINLLIDALRSAEPIHLELDRNMRVLLPSQAVGKMEIPPDFFALSPEEIKKAQQLRTEVLEQTSMLRTKAMRERDEMRQVRMYKYTLLRIRFPNGIFLQGTFSIYDKITDVINFVKENLENEELPFLLVSPAGQKFSSEQNYENNLGDLRFVPAVILMFAWDPVIAESVQNSSQKDTFLKSEVMLLLQST